MTKSHSLMRIAIMLWVTTCAFGETIVVSLSETGTTFVSDTQAVPFDITLPGFVNGTPQNIETLTFNMAANIGGSCGGGTLGLCFGFLSDSASISAANVVSVAAVGYSGDYSDTFNNVDPFIDGCLEGGLETDLLSCTLALPIGRYLLTVGLSDSFSAQNGRMISQTTEAVTGIISGAGVAPVPEPVTGLLMVVGLLLLLRLPRRTERLRRRASPTING
jgi:hypothetical protein